MSNYYDILFKTKRNKNNFTSLSLTGFLLWISLATAAQHDSCYVNDNPKKMLFYGGTLDVFHYNGTKHLMRTSPLDIFSRHKNLYPEIPNVEIEAIAGTMGFVDKNYAAEWIIIDSILYLSNINFDDCFSMDPKVIEKLYPNKEQYIRMEKLTGEKFKKYKPKNKEIQVSDPGHLLRASWFTGTLYIKKPLDYEHNESYPNWLRTVFYRLTLKNGKLISITETYKVDKTDLLKIK